MSHPWKVGQQRAKGAAPDRLSTQFSSPITLESKSMSDATVPIVKLIVPVVKVVINHRPDANLANRPAPKRVAGFSID